MLDGNVSHDQVTRHLSGPKKTSADLWQIVKPFVRKLQSAEGVLIIDDAIEEKPDTDENEIVGWHYDHAKERTVKGSNFVTSLYASQGVSLPVGFQLMAKTETDLDQKMQQEKRRSPVSKNEIARQLITQAVKNQMLFRYVLFDAWFSSAENMRFIKQAPRRDFSSPLKTNRKVALSLADKLQGHFHRVETLELAEKATREVYLEGVWFPLLLVKQVCTNEDGSIGILYLVASDTTLSFDDLTTRYQRRMASRVLPQVVNTERLFTEISDPQGNHPNQSFLCRLVRFYQLGDAQS